MTAEAGPGAKRIEPRSGLLAGTPPQHSDGTKWTFCHGEARTDVASGPERTFAASIMDVRDAQKVKFTRQIGTRRVPRDRL